jgi:hypothetical protein
MPIVQGVNWKYMDITQLAYALKEKSPLPEEVQKLQHTFDIVTEMHGFFDLDHRDAVIDFFIRPGGYVFLEGIAK